MHILINDFIGGVLDRGIPLYVRNLIEGLKEEGVRVSVVRASPIFRKIPRGFFYVISCCVEQFILPVAGLILQADITLYPYNSIAIADILSGRGRIVVHDLELLDRSPWSPSRLYCHACYAVIRVLAFPVFTIADIVRNKIVASKTFGKAPILILPNTFYDFEILAAQTNAKVRKKTILLCTGSTPNKDLATLVRDYLPLVLRKGWSISIMGLHKKNDAATLTTLSGALASGQLIICGQLTDRDVVRAYKTHEIVWVHSLREGFGRCVVEGRLVGRPVICSAISEFATLQDGGVRLYATPAQFAERLAAFSDGTGENQPYRGYPYRTMLRQALDRDFWRR
jgi:glycosyltransferase involved in cell wall biosynthesis